MPGFLCKITPAGRCVHAPVPARTQANAASPLWVCLGELTVEQSPRHGAGLAGVEVRRGGDPGGASAEARKAPTMMAELCKVHGGPPKNSKPSTWRAQAVIDRCIVPMLGRRRWPT